MASQPQLQRRHTVSFLACAASGANVHPAKKHAGEELRHTQLAERSTVEGDEKKRSGTGILVHGCHLKADGWEHIVWGSPPHELGRLPHAVLLAWEEQASVVLFGTGASEKDGKKESEYTLQYLWDHWAALAEFEPLHRVPLDGAEALMRRISIVDAQTQNTDDEVREGLRRFQDHACDHAIFVSSPTHLPRCLACACKVVEQEPELFSGPIYASPSDTCYEGAAAGDVVVVEPPHRGDRDKSLDALKFHELVRRCYRVPRESKAEFLEQLGDLLQRHGA
mmetsp:Transcript_91593/g.290560  ORF Transcript_91593/g.290560 Transcript_91593/m.290560 type:complete len:280 (-) Transcript_91593:44-883(-)